jgi:hypothetical protein
VAQNTFTDSGAGQDTGYQTTTSGHCGTSGAGCNSSSGSTGHQFTNMDLTGNSTTNYNYSNASANIKGSTSLNKISKLERPTSFNTGLTKNVILSAYSLNNSTLQQQHQHQCKQLGATSAIIDSSGINSSLTSTPMSICGDGYEEEYGIYNSTSNGCVQKQQATLPNQQKEASENRVLFKEKSPNTHKKPTSTSISLNSLQNIQPVGKLLKKLKKNSFKLFKYN